MNLIFIVFPVTAGLIGITIILVNIFRKHNVEFYIRDEKTSNEISANINFYSKKRNIKFYLNEDKPLIKLRKRRYAIRVESSGYKPKEEIIKSWQSPIVIYMEKKKQDILPLPVLLNTLCWKGIEVTSGTYSNELIVNSDGEIFDAAGFFSTGHLVLRNKTLILYFSNTEKSKFYEQKMVKLEINNDVLIHPNVPLDRDGYFFAEDTKKDAGIKFNIPQDFTGRMNFVFYKANIKDLKISFFYK